MRYLLCASPVVNGPRMSRPHLAKGQGDDRDFSS
ncbi:hypothetical protein A2U01_0104702, partial [Trifolium medium]|nr:hypothetical protein [Trifolium medium]